MPTATPAAFDAPLDVGRAPRVAAVRNDTRLSIHDDLSCVADDWRAFEQSADCTAFQTFAWLSAWQRHVGERQGVTPAVVAGRDAHGALSFIIPLAIERRGLARALTFLGSELCDYNAPLLSPDFPHQIGVARFVALWDEIVARLRAHPRLGFDLVRFEKMPESVGAQSNPMLGLPVMPNASNAHHTQLAGDWETFYAAKRSSATRRRDRAKRKRLAEVGEIRFVSPQSAGDVERTLDTLIEHKTRQFRAMGVANLFARAGHREFLRAVATDAAMRPLVHVSRLDVGPAMAAVNLGLTFRGVYYHLLAGYDRGELSRFGPGVTHLHELFGHAIERGFRVFDFTIGDEIYKRPWCDRELKLYDHVSAVTPRGLGIAWALIAKLRVKRWVKRTPALWGLFQQVRSWFAPLFRVVAR